jgi:hypothetical protein
VDGLGAVRCFLFQADMSIAILGLVYGLGIVWVLIFQAKSR